MLFSRHKSELPDPADALPGRSETMPVPDRHDVLGTPITPPFPEGSQQLVVGMGCFWGAERMFWETPGVITTAVGYAGGFTPNPTYEEVCSGRTGHTEAVLVVFDPEKVEPRGPAEGVLGGPRPDPGHAPGQRHGHPVPVGHLRERRRAAGRGRGLTGHVPGAPDRGRATATITTEIAEAGAFYYAEPYHQQYLSKVPNGYCGLGGTGVSCPIGVAGA